MENNKPKLRVLISGLGVAGPVLAYWLLRTTAVQQITIIERDATERTKGQAIDIRDGGVDVLEKMGLADAVRARGTTERGLSFVDTRDRTWATFMATGDPSAQGITSEFEILRGDLATLFLEQIQDDARMEFLLGNTLSGLRQEGDRVHVEFSDGAPGREFDLVVAADGLGSAIRGWIYNEPPKTHIKGLGMWLGLWTAPSDLLGPSKIAKLHIPGGSKSVLVRPDRYGTTRLTFMVGGAKAKGSRVLPTYHAAKREGMQAVKDQVKFEFRTAKWQVPEMLATADAATDFWASEIAQVKVPDYYRGRVALLGDAGYCPSPLTGVGTTAAMVGAYVLAGEIGKAPHDLDRALQGYQRYVAARVDRWQSIPPGAPDIFMPRSGWGVTVLLSIVGLFSRLHIDVLANGVSALLPASWKTKLFDIPEYEWVQ